jgi:hypothetical protein
MPAKRLPPRPDLDHLKYQARDVLTDHRAGSPDAIRRIREFHPRFGTASDAEIGSALLKLSDVQLTIAREHGFASWPKLKRHVEGLQDIERRVADLRAAFARADRETRRRLLETGHAAERFESYHPDAASISEADARLLVANREGYAFWRKYESYLHLDPSVQAVIAAVRSGDRARLQEVLRADPWASNPRWVAGLEAPRPIPNDSIPLFCVSEGAFRGTNTHGTEGDMTQLLDSLGSPKAHSCQRAKGRLLSAAREPAPTQPGSRRSEPSFRP